MHYYHPWTIVFDDILCNCLKSANVVIIIDSFFKWNIHGIVKSFVFSDICNRTCSWEEISKSMEREGHTSISEIKSLFNPISMMANSGARGSTNQIRQLSGMRGLMASPSGSIIELPIKANFREGLTVLEFFQSSHGSRKALSDTALRTADSGYLTRRLVDVSQEVIVREEDCFAARREKIRGITVTAIGSERDPIEKLIDRIVGRVAAEDVVNPTTGEVIVPCNEMITYDKGNEIVACGIKAVQIRSVLTCRNETGVCVKCYGQDLAHGGYVNIGEAVGIVAAQAIGEPGTQLTMRTFHTGGVASEKDITQGLPRVEELFEARKPKREAMLAEISGTISLGENKKKRELIITSDDGTMKAYPIAYGSRLKVKEGDRVVAGDELTEGQINPHDLLRILGVKAVQEHLLKEVLMVYRLQGVGIGDKHIEVIVHQMLRKVRIEDAGDTNMLPGSMVDIFKFERENERVEHKFGVERFRVDDRRAVFGGGHVFNRPQVVFAGVRACHNRFHSAAAREPARSVDSLAGESEHFSYKLSGGKVTVIYIYVFREHLHRVHRREYSP